MANKQTKTAAKVKDKRNLKYGSLSVTVTVIFVALVIILNIIATSFSPYTDMTASGFYSLSDDFTEEMNKLLQPESGEDVYLNIVLLSEEDVFSGASQMTMMLYETFKELVKTFDHINLVAYNTTVHPELAEKYEVLKKDGVNLHEQTVEREMLIMGVGKLGDIEKRLNS